MSKDEYIDIVFTGPPAPESGQFVEVENDQEESICFGEWVERRDGYWALRIPNSNRLKAKADALLAIINELRIELDDHSDVIDNPEGGSPRPNLAMRVLQFLDEQLEKIK